MWVAVTADAPSSRSAKPSGSSVARSGSTSAKSTDPPAQSTACAEAENVKLGMTTRPVAPSACRTSISPAVQLDTATASTPSRADTASSSRRTVAPLVNSPRSRMAPSSAVRPGTSSRVGRTSGSRSGKAGAAAEHRGRGGVGGAHRTTTLRLSRRPVALRASKSILDHAMSSSRS